MKIKILPGALALLAAALPTQTSSNELPELAVVLPQINVLITQVHTPPGANEDNQVLQLDRQYQLSLYQLSGGKYTADLLDSAGRRLYSGLFVKVLNCSDGPAAWPGNATGQVVAAPPAGCVLKVGTADLTVTTQVLAPPPDIQITLTRAHVASALAVGQTYRLHVSQRHGGFFGDIYSGAGNRLYADAPVDTTNCFDSSPRWPDITRGIVTYTNATPPDCVVRVHIAPGLVFTAKFDPKHNVGEGLPYNPLYVPKKQVTPTQ